MFRGRRDVENEVGASRCRALNRPRSRSTVTYENMLCVSAILHMQIKALRGNHILRFSAECVGVRSMMESSSYLSFRLVRSRPMMAGTPDVCGDAEIVRTCIPASHNVTPPCTRETGLMQIKHTVVRSDSVSRIPSQPEASTTEFQQTRLHQHPLPLLPSVRSDRRRFDLAKKLGLTGDGSHGVVRVRLVILLNRVHFAAFVLNFCGIRREFHASLAYRAPGAARNLLLTDLLDRSPRVHSDQRRS
nr:hypothetical protein CFP56_44403 [Quercus suber]